MARYSCGACSLECTIDIIQCGSCQNWVHKQCEGLTKSQFQIIVNVPETIEYRCCKCNLNSDGTFDFHSSLNRLEEAADKTDFSELQQAVKIEEIFLRKIKNNITSAKGDQKKLFVDTVSYNLVLRHGQRNPVSVTVDGNCLFNSISVALFQNESASEEIRVKTCIELVSNKVHYELALECKGLSVFAYSYEEACRCAARNHSFQDHWAMMAACNVVKHKIQSCYPPVHGLHDVNFSHMNTVHTPRVAIARLQTIYIMWTSVQAFNPKFTWTPNHFVPLMKMSESNPNAFLSISSNDNLFSANKTPSSVGKTKCIQSSSIGSARQAFCDSDTCIFKTPLSFSVDACEEKRELDPQLSTPLSSETICNTSNDDDKSINGNTTNNVIGTRNNGKFLPNDIIIERLVNDETTISTAPRGVKENIYFVVNNSHNMGKKKKVWADDCGVWVRGTVKKHHYINRGGSFVYIDFNAKDNVYVKTIRGKRVPLESQPEAGDVLVKKVYYSKLKWDPQYERRISWIEIYPTEMKVVQENIALWEYIGLFPNYKSLHGNVRLYAREYVRKVKTSNSLESRVQIVSMADPENP